MPKTLILGTTPQGIALERTLVICTGWTLQVTRDEPEWLFHDGNLSSQQRVSWRREIKHYDVVVALPSLLRHTSEAISLVHRLRTHLYWEGRFIAVVMNDRRAGELRRASFVGEPIEGTYFGQIPGHVVLTVPLQIPELLSLLNEPDDWISLDYWHFDLLRSGQAVQLNRQIEKANHVLKDSQVDADVRSVSREIMMSLDTIDWSLVADRGRGHALDNAVQSLLEEYVAKEHLTIEDCSVIVKKARRILAQSTFPFPPEE